MLNSSVRRARESVWGPTSTRVRRNPWLRRPAIAGYRVLARVALRGTGPKVLVNSVPKAGTHLLTQLLGSFPHMWFSGLHITDAQFRAGDVPAGADSARLDVDALDRHLRAVRKGQFVSGHVAWSPEVGALLSAQGFRRLLIIRDPRDLVVSRVYYVAGRPQHRDYDRLVRQRDSFEDRLIASISGLEPEGDHPGAPSIGERLRRYRGWLDDPDTCVVRFEDLVGTPGGGSESAQREAITRVLRHCGREPDDVLVTRLAASVYARHSATFRRGVIGDWQHHFRADHRAAFDQVVDRADLEAFGYA